MLDDIPRYDRDDLGLYRSNMGHWCEWHRVEAVLRERDTLRVENARLKAIEQTATKLLFDNGGPTGGDTDFGIPDEFVLAKIEDFQSLEAAINAVKRTAP